MNLGFSTEKLISFLNNPPIHFSFSSELHVCHPESQNRQGEPAKIFTLIQLYYHIDLYIPSKAIRHVRFRGDIMLSIVVCVIASLDGKCVGIIE